MGQMFSILPDESMTVFNWVLVAVGICVGRV